MFAIVAFGARDGRTEDGKLWIEAQDAGGAVVPCRVHLSGADGKPIRAPGSPFFRDHFTAPGGVELTLPVGKYRYEIERGPEFERAAGTVLVSSRPAKIVASIGRISNLRADGWYSGDLHIHRPPGDIETLARAEDLDVAPVITWWNNRNLWSGRAPPRRVLRRFDGSRYAHVMAGEDEREGGALLYFGLEKPIEITGASREHPSPLDFVAAARAANSKVWIDIEKPFWWDVPVWLALGDVHSIGIANNHMCRSTVLGNEAWGRPRDTERLPAPHGNGYWTQEIYYHALNAGLRVPPSAGSASGVLPNPVGYNRVYVHVPGEFTYEKWWEGLRAGRSFVTNGPLLQVKASGDRPGASFRGPEGHRFEIPLEIEVVSNDALDRIELVQNGEIAVSLPAGGARRHQARATVLFTASGWFLVRVFARNERTFRFASTAPYFVEIGANARPVRKPSTEFFLRWARERADRVRKNLAGEPKKLADVIAYHERAIRFWEEKVSEAD